MKYNSSERSSDAPFDIIGFFMLLLTIYIPIAWVVNLIQFFRCDFTSPYKDEVIHLVGILVPPAAGITVWL